MRGFRFVLGKVSIAREQVEIVVKMLAEAVLFPCAMVVSEQGVYVTRRIRAFSSGFLAGSLGSRFRAGTSGFGAVLVPLHGHAARPAGRWSVFLFQLLQEGFRPGLIAALALVAASGAAHVSKVFVTEARLALLIQ